MPLDFPIAVLLCDVGEPSGSPLTSAAAEAVIGPDGAWSVLDGWQRATYGYLDVSGSRVIPATLEIDPSELIEASETDSAGRVTGYTMSRRKIGDRAVELAEDAGHDLSGFDGVIVIARQGTLRYRGKPVKPYQGGGSTLSDGRKMCDLAHDAWLYLMAHEVGHVFGYPESFGLRSRAWGWNAPPFSLTPSYGDPYCVMSASIRFDGGRFDYLSGRPLSSDWPAATFDSAGPGPALALTRQVHPRALRENGCVRRMAFDEWHGPTPVVRIHAGSDPTRDRVKLLVLDGPARAGTDPERTVYVEYRPAAGLDLGLEPDPAATSTTCAAVVIHELVDTRLCIPENDDNRGNPACVAVDGDVRARGRRDDQGLHVHYRARIPVPPPLSRDWLAGNDGPLISITDVSADGTWIEIAVSPAPRGVYRSVYFRPHERTETARTVALRLREKAPSLCAPTTTPANPGRPGRPPTLPVLARTFPLTVDVVDQQVDLRIAVLGFGNDRDGGPRGDNPRITWSLGGSDLVAPDAGGSPISQTLNLTLPVQRYDLTTGESLPSTPMPVVVSARALPDGTLELVGRGSNGNFNLPIAVTAESTAGGGQSVRNEFTVLFTGHQVTRSAELLRLLRACLRRIQDPSRLNQFVTPPWKRRPQWTQDLRDRLVTRPDRFDGAGLEDLNLAAAAYLKLQRAGDLVRARQVADIADRILGVDLPQALTV